MIHWDKQLHWFTQSSFDGFFGAVDFVLRGRRRRRYWCKSDPTLVSIACRCLWRRRCRLILTLKHLRDWTAI